MAECLGNGHDVFCSVGPDAPIEGISVSPSSVKPGEEITIKSKIHGIGAWWIACGNFTLKYYFDGVYIGCYEDRITKGETWWVPFKYTIPVGTSAGPHQVKATEKFSGTVRSIVVTVVVPEGKAVITNVRYPETFEPSKTFSIQVTFKNTGGPDYFFVRIVDKDTGENLSEERVHLISGTSWDTLHSISLSQTTDFHGRVEAGHET